MSDLVERVYRIFDPAPLLAEEEDLYVNLDEVRGHSNVVDKLAKNIRLSDKPTCQIVAGHRGSGKSTELRRLQRALENTDPKIFVVFCVSDDDVDRNDVDFPDVLIAILRQLAAQLKQRAKIKLKPGYFEGRWERLKDVLGREVSFEKLDLGAGMLKISGAIKGSPDARGEVRKLLEPDVSNWLHAANDVIGEAKQKLQKKGYEDLVIVVDDLDKIVVRPHVTAKCSTAEYLFVHREAQLSAFMCHMVYTMPIALAYSVQEQSIENLYGTRPPVIPMTTVSSHPPDCKPSEPGVQKFRDLIATRLARANAREDAIFAGDEVRDLLINLSGGQPRELMILIREAIIGGELPIDMTAVERAGREGKRAYARQLRAEHWSLIDEVRQSGTIVRTEENVDLVRELLDSRAILVYRNDEEWYNVNPLMADLKSPAKS